MEKISCEFRIDDHAAIVTRIDNIRLGILYMVGAVFLFDPDRDRKMARPGLSDPVGPGFRRDDTDR